MVRRKAAGAPARRHSRCRTSQTAEQREPASPVRRESQRGWTLDREADGRRHSHWHGSTSKCNLSLFIVKNNVLYRHAKVKCLVLNYAVKI